MYIFIVKHVFAHARHTPNNIFNLNGRRISSRYSGEITSEQKAMNAESTYRSAD